MKNLNISTYGVEEMSKQEMKTTDGGLWPLVVVAAIYLWDNREEIVEGWKKGEELADKHAKMYM